MLVLVFPVATTFASMANDGASSFATKHCPDKIQTLSSASKHQLFAVVTAMNDHNKCKKNCCPNGNCVCNVPCHQLSSSANPTLFNNQNISSSFHAYMKILFSDFKANPLNNIFLPALRPPIC